MQIRTVSVSSKAYQSGAAHFQFNMGLATNNLKNFVTRAYHTEALQLWKIIENIERENVHESITNI